MKSQEKDLVFGNRRAIRACAGNDRPPGLEAEAGLARYKLIVQELKRRIKLGLASNAWPRSTSKNVNPTPVVEPAAIASQFRIITLQLPRRRSLAITKANKRHAKRQLDAPYLFNTTQTGRAS